MSGDNVSRVITVAGFGEYDPGAEWPRLLKKSKKAGVTPTAFVELALLEFFQRHPNAEHVEAALAKSQ